MIQIKVNLGSVEFQTLQKEFVLEKKMASQRIAMIHEIITKEIMVLILKKLDFQTLTIAFKVCAKWRNLIHGFDLFNIKNFSKYLYENEFQFHLKNCEIAFLSHIKNSKILRI